METFQANLDAADESTIKKVKHDDDITIAADRDVRLYLTPVGRFDPRSCNITHILWQSVAHYYLCHVCMYS